MKISVVIPAKDEGEGIKGIIEQVTPFANEVIVIDGHSKDNTREIAAQHGATVISDNNKGKGDAYRVGINAAEGDIIVFIDGDGSHEPKDIPRLVESILQQKADLVVGSRMLGGSDEFHGNFYNYVRMVGGGLITLIINLRFNVALTDCLNGFRAIKKDVALDLNLQANQFDIEQEMVIKCLKKGYQVGEVPSHEYERQWGKSKLPTFSRAHHFFFRLFKELFPFPSQKITPHN
ncbi:MAG: glycosyltransferase family 2 protein [Nitrospirota bacterium]